AAKIVAEDIEVRTYNQIMAGLRALGSDYPVDKAVTEGLIRQDCYDRSPEMCRYILWLYEEDLARTLGAGATVDEHDRKAIWRQRASDSIEHIFPQTPGTVAGWLGKMRRGKGRQEPVEDHVGRIGNLLLLPQALNEQAQNHPFEKKKQLYAKHNLRMIKEVSSQAEWTLTEIEAREARIADWARSRWADL
ncbi:MAG TPA: HNH endonuclease family protein, partial [Symbiobacteriaceae bacterium]|nr:HNH endonuclease family protein [Symbiobacteriaceae bacterium]